MAFVELHRWSIGKYLFLVWLQIWMAVLLYSKVICRTFSRLQAGHISFSSYIHRGAGSKCSKPYLNFRTPHLPGEPDWEWQISRNVIIPIYSHWSVWTWNSPLIFFATFCNYAFIMCYLFESLCFTLKHLRLLLWKLIEPVKLFAAICKVEPNKPWYFVWFLIPATTWLHVEKKTHFVLSPAVCKANWPMILCGSSDRPIPWVANAL